MDPIEFAEIRTELGITVSECGLLFGIGRRAVHRWEGAESSIPHAAAMLLRIAKKYPEVLGYLRLYKFDKGESTAGVISNSQHPSASFRIAELSVKNFTRQELITVFQACGGLCYYCRRVVDAKFHPRFLRGFDHKIPICKGGKHEISNLVVCCRRCNLRKGFKDPEVFRASQSG